MRRELIDCHVMAREREIYETMTEIQLGSRLVGSAKSEARQPSRQHSRDWATALSPTGRSTLRGQQVILETRIQDDHGKK